MLAVVATLKVQDGKGPELEALFRELAAQVRANEPGNLAYQLTKSRVDPDTYKVLEAYADEEAFKQHSRSEHFRAAGAKLAAVLAGRPEIEQLDVVV